jgi:hypothetical protein
MRKIIAEIGALYLRVAICLFAVIGLFALVGTELRWFSPTMPSVKKVLSIDPAERFAGYKPFFSARIPVDTSRAYRLRVAVRVLPRDDGTKQISRIYLGVRTYDVDGKELKSGPGSYRYAGAANVQLTSDDGWKTLTGTIAGEGDTSHNQFRPGTKSVEVALLVNYKADETVVSEVRDLRFAELIPLDR